MLPIKDEKGCNTGPIQLTGLNKETALEILNKYNFQAHNHDLKDKFEEAANVYYGQKYKHFQVRSDDSKRLFFFCITCNKPLNNTNSLAQHSNSGKHLKKLALSPIALENDNEDDVLIDRIVKKDDCFKDPNSLQSQLERTKQYILGLQMVEEYFGKGGKVYYICTFCNAHGRTPDMVKHLLGNYHTENYIRFHVNLLNTNLTAEEKMYFREKLFKEQKYTLSHITVYKNPRLYPVILENEGITRNRDVKISSPSHCSSLASSSSKRKHAEIESEDGLNSKTLYSYRNPSPPPMDIEEIKCDNATQTIDSDSYQNIMTNLETFVLLHQTPDPAPIRSYEDVILCLTISFSLLHILYFATKKVIEMETEIVEENSDSEIQLKNIRKCMNLMKSNLQKRINNGYPDLPNFHLSTHRTSK